MAATPRNVEMEAAKFLHKLIQESTDEPTKLATKLHVILQHMRSSGKENSMPYQVISRAMETVINRHGLDIDALMSSRQPLTSGPQAGDSSLSQIAGPSQQIAVENDSKKPLTAEDTAKIAAFSSKPLHGPSSAGHDIYQGSANQLNSMKTHGSNAGFSESAEPGNPRSMQFSSSYDNQNSATLMHKGPVGKLDHEGGFPNASKTLQGGNIGEMGMLRNEGSGKSTAPAVGAGPFKEHHLKQLRAQCLVFLAFRNNLMPKKLHLEIALGNVFPKEDISSKEHVDQKGKEQSSGPGSSSSGFVSETNILKEGDKVMTERNDPPPEHSLMIPRKFETDVQTFEAKEPLMSATKQLDPTNMSGLFAIPDNQVNRHVPSVTQRENWKPHSGMEGDRQMVGPKHANVLEKDAIIGSNQEGESTSPSVTAKFTTCEKWIADCQKRKVADDSNWAVKKKKTEQKISASVEKLKETVSSSEDISAKTKSVIELKKLELLNLQRRLRNEILSDFFRPTSNEMDRLKSIKKHRIGRRSKQLERHELKMKEERQKRIRERQKDFFGEMEQHRERLEDVFKFRRERLKGFNKYAREFHKRKERLYREKIDRIQREKINLLKINDVEGYLRMVQDAKSDRVKQLLKETEKYLQKLGSKLKEAKVISRCFESDMSGVNDSSEFTIENEDETDQAKHYMESNEKYYLMAHSIKETVAEQPSSLIGGKLREYQMNGLRWLLSLYNNHLNGILADEMGLGKTVQVISLLCYLMENKNDRGPFLVVVPSSVLPGWESEISFWAPSIIKIVYSGPPEERRKLFKERIVQQKFNVLLTTYEYLMNKHDRPKLSKIHWHYVIIDEGHRIKNASCKLNAELKHYHSSHRLLLTGTPLQNNLEELWALLNFLLPNIFNSSEDFSQWFNKPFESNSDNSLEEALLSEEENLLIINRLHQVLRPFVLRRLKHKVENELPGKIERLVRCEASAYQKLLMQRVEDNRGAFGATKARAVHNTVVELRNICNHPYISQLHSEQVHDFIPKHYLPNIIRFCGKLEMLDRLLPKLKATDHRILLFSTMTRLLDVMEDYLYLKQYRYLRLDGHTSGGDRGALIDQFNAPGSPFFIFLLSIRAGGVGVNLQAADTVIIFDTDWNPQVDLQAQARAHRIGQKKEVLVLRLETVKTVEEQVRASAEHKLGVANQSITAGFFDNNTSAEDRREYLEALLRECKKEEAAPVLNDDALNDLMARSESEIDVFEEIDKKRNEEELAIWKKVVSEQGGASGELVIPPLPSRLVTENELNSFCEAMKAIEVPRPVVVPGIGGKRRGELGSLDMQHYGRGKRAREVRSYEEQWTEDEFEKLCQAENPDSPNRKEEPKEVDLPIVASESGPVVTPEVTVLPDIQPTNDLTVQQTKDVNVNSNPSSKRGRGRPKKKSTEISPSPIGLPVSPVPVTLSVAPTVQIPPDSQMDITSPGSKSMSMSMSKSNPSENVQSAVPNVTTLAPPPGFQQQPASHPPGFQPISSPPGFQQITPPPPGFQPKITPPTPVSGPSSSQSTLTAPVAPQSTTTIPPVPPSQSKSTPVAPVSVPILSPTSPDSLSPTTTPIRGRGRGRGRGRARGRGRGRGQIVESEVDVPQQQRGRKSHNVVLAIPGLRTSSPAGKQVTDSLVVTSTVNDSKTVNDPLVSTSPAINAVSNTNTPALATVSTPVTVTETATATAAPKSDIASPTTPVPSTVVDSVSVVSQSTEVGSMSSQTAVTPVVAPVVMPVVSAPIGSSPPNPGIKQGRGRGRKTVTSGSETPRRRRRKQDDSEEQNSNEPVEKKTRVSSGRKSVATRSMLRNQTSVTDDNSKSSEPLVESSSNVKEQSNILAEVVEPKDNTVATESGLKTHEVVESKPKEESDPEKLSILEVKENEASKEVEKSLAGESSLPQKADPVKAENEVIVEKKTETEKTADSPMETEPISSNKKVEEKLEHKEKEKVANDSNMTSSLSQGEGDDIATIEGSNLAEKDAKSTDDETPEDSAVDQGGKENEPVEKPSHGDDSLPQKPEPLTEDEKQAAECSASEDDKTEVIVPENELPVEEKVEQGKLEPEEKEKVVTDPVKEDSNTEPIVTQVEKKESDDVACTEAKISETEKGEETEQQKVGDVNAEKAIDDMDEHITQCEAVEMNKSESLLEIDVKPSEIVENELGSSEINKGENEHDGGTKIEVDDKSPEKIDDAAASNDKDVTQGGSEDDGNTLMEIDDKSPEKKTLTEDDQSIKQVPAVQVEKRESDDVACTEAKLSETEKDEETEHQKVGEVNVDKQISQGEGVEMNKSESLLEIDVKPSEIVENELESSETNKGENEDDKSPEKMDDAAAVGSNDKDVTEDEESNKQLLLPQGGNEDDEGTKMEIDYKSPEKKILTKVDQSIKQVPAAQEDEIEVSGNIDNAMVVETESKLGETVIEAEQKTDIIPLAEGEEKSSEMINKEPETSDKVVNSVDEQPLVETTKEVSVTDSAAALPNEVEEMSTDVKKLVDENEKLVSENEKLDTTKEVSVTDSASVSNDDEEQISTDVEKLVGENEKLETTKEVSVTDSAAVVPNEEEEMLTDVEKLVDENEKLEKSGAKSPKDEITEETDERMTEECGDDVTEEKVVAPETDKKEADHDDDSAVQKIAAETLIESMDDAKISVEETETETEPCTTIIDDPTAVDPSQTITDDSTVQEIAAETLSDKENAAETLIEPSESVDEERETAPSKTITDDPTAVDPSKTIIHDSTVQENAAETLIGPSESVDEETEIEPSQTIIDDPTAVDASTTLNNDSTVQEIAAETSVDKENTAETLIEPSESVDEAEPSKTITEDPTVVDPSTALNNDSTILQEHVADDAVEQGASKTGEEEDDDDSTVQENAAETTDDPTAVDPSTTLNNDPTISQEQLVDDMAHGEEEEDDSTVQEKAAETLTESVDDAKTSVEETETTDDSDQQVAADVDPLHNDSTITQEQVGGKEKEVVPETSMNETESVPTCTTEADLDA